MTTDTARAYDVDEIRSHFPALSLRDEAGRSMAFFDGPGGTQVPTGVIDAVSRYYRESNANSGGAFLTSERSDAIAARAHEAIAELLNAKSGDEIKFGANMTSLTFHIGRSIGATLRPGDEIVLTALDHEANVSTWRAMAADRDVIVRMVDVNVEDGTLDLDDLDRKLSERTRLVAVGYASNALGTINPVAEIVRRAHAVGALTYVDAVHFAPHGPIDVQALDTDFLVCSAYKFFGPHVGILYGRHELLERHRPYKVRPASDEPPHSWETGTVNLEGIAGTAAAIAYLQGLGMPAVRAYERELAERLLDGLVAIDGVTLYGTRSLDRRVPTAAFTVAGRTPAEVSATLGASGIFVWDGNYYALELMERLGLEERGGAVRVGAVHYNTAEEIDRFLEAVAAL